MEWPTRFGDRRRMTSPWWRDPNTVDGYRADGVPWPVETSRYAYLAPFGGFSEDLGVGYIGLNRQALEENTELQPGDEVTITVFEGANPIPLLMRPTFEVVPLDFQMPDAYLHSTEGEAVLSERDTDRTHLGIETALADLRVVLNGVLACQMRGPGS